MAVGIVEPDIQGLEVRPDNRSGIHDFTYILFNQSLKRDLKGFHDVYPYRRVGIIADENIIAAVVKNSGPLRRLARESRAAFTLVPIVNGIVDVLVDTSRFDAAFLGHLGRFEGEEKQRLIAALTQKKIPSFGASMGDIDAGALAAISPEESAVKINRRVALNIESLINGTNFSQ